MSAGRYAVYYAPDAASALWRRACEWLGRDACSGETLRPLEVHGLCAERFRDMTASPRHYGFHATLKAPIRLAYGFGADDLIEFAADWASRRPAFAVHLECAWCRDFLALRPAHATCAGRLRAFAADCVCDFDHFRRPMSRSERERRLRAPLSVRQQQLALRWGYPYVLDEYRFHMTLSQPVCDERERDALMAGALDWFSEFAREPLLIDGISLFHQPGSAADFERVAYLPFSGSG